MRDWLDMQGTAPLALAVGLLVLRESSRDQIDSKHIGRITLQTRRARDFLVVRRNLSQKP
jgi:hypothetical protein